MRALGERASVARDVLAETERSTRRGAYDVARVRGDVDGDRGARWARRSARTLSSARAGEDGRDAARRRDDGGRHAVQCGDALGDLQV